MLTCSLGEGRTLQISGRLGKYYELYFDSRGNPVAFRIKVLVDHLGYEWILHRRSGARMPKGWRQNCKLEEHDTVAFQSKLQSFFNVAAIS